MDYMKALAINNHRIVHEAVVSSLLNFLVTPTADHGFRHEFLSSFLEALNESAKEPLFKYRDRRDFWAPLEGDPPRARVSADYTNDPALGTIDSLITIEKSDTVWLIGIEVRVRDDAELAAAGLQLERYTQILDNERRRYIVNLSHHYVEVVPVLAFVTPGSGRSTATCELARTSSAECERLSICGPILVPWNKVREGNWEGVTLCRKSIGDILEQLLDDYLRGRIPAPDAQAADLVRSLRNAIRTNFRSLLKQDCITPSFPDEIGYLQSLGECQWKWYTTLLEIVKERTGTTDPMVAEKENTVIGIPRRANPRGAENTLCRIRTTSSYLTGESVELFQIELPADSFKPRIGQLQEILGAFETPVQLLGLDSVLYHENGREDEGVILLEFANISKDSKGVRADLSRLVDFLEKVFDETH